MKIKIENVKQTQGYVKYDLVSYIDKKEKDRITYTTPDILFNKEYMENYVNLLVVEMAGMYNKFIPRKYDCSNYIKEFEKKTFELEDDTNIK